MNDYIYARIIVKLNAIEIKLTKMLSRFMKYTKLNIVIRLILSSHKTLRFDLDTIICMLVGCIVFSLSFSCNIRCSHNFQMEP